MMTRPDAEWILEALQQAGLAGEIVGSLAAKKQSRHDIDIVVKVVADPDYQTYWHTLERIGFRYERTDPPPSSEIWSGRGRDGSLLILDIHPTRT